MIARTLSLALVSAAVLLSACQSDPPKPEPCKVCGYGGQGVPPGVVLPPGLATPFNAGESAALPKATPLRTSPSPGGDAVDQIPAGGVVKLRTRMLNGIGPWWLVDYKINSGWIRESELPPPR